MYAYLCKPEKTSDLISPTLCYFYGYLANYQGGVEDDESDNTDFCPLTSCLNITIIEGIPPPWKKNMYQITIKFISKAGALSEGFPIFLTYAKNVPKSLKRAYMSQKVNNFQS